MMISPPRGANTATNFAHPSVGCAPAALRIPTPTSGAGPLQAMPSASWSRPWRSFNTEYRLIKARRWPSCGVVRRAPRRGLVGVLRLRETLWRSHGARVARRRDCAAFGYVVNRATSDRVQPLRFFILVGSRGGAAVDRSGHGGEGFALPGVWGCNPLPWSRPRRRAGRRYWRVQGAAPDQTVSMACHRNINAV